MARHNLKLNYDDLEKMAASCLELASSLDGISNAVKNMERTISNCQGQAATAIAGDGDEIVGIIEKLSDGLNRFGTETNNFCGDMRAIINSQGVGMLNVNSWDCTYNLGQMITDLVNINYDAKKSKKKISYSTNGLSMAMIPQNDISEINRINAQLENVVEIMKAGASELLKYEEDLQKFKKIITEFENKDDEYRNSMQNIYYDVADVKWYQKTSSKIIIAVAVIAVAAAIVLLAPAIAGLAAVGGTVGAIATFLSSSAVVGVATNIVAVGIGTGVLSGGIAIFTGDDIEDSFGTGLMDGVIVGTINGGVGAIANSTKLGVIGTKISEYASAKDIMISGETTRFALYEGLSFTGEFSASVVDCLYNGKDINLLKIGATSAFNVGMNNLFDAGGMYISKNYLEKDVNVFKNGDLSITDIKKGLKNFMTNKSIESVKEVTGQAGEQVIDNAFENNNIVDAEYDIQMEKIPEKLAEEGLNNTVKKSLKNMAENIANSKG